MDTTIDFINEAKDAFKPHKAPYQCSLCIVGEHCHWDSNNSECECWTCMPEDEFEEITREGDR